MSKRRLAEADILRGMAILAVVMIHVLNMPVRNLAPVWPDNPFFYFHGLLNFAVPCFFILSAVMVSYTLGDAPLQPGIFYRKKLFRIALPYLLWSLAYLMAMLIIHVVSWEDFLSPSKWAGWILAGRAYTHLYFIALLIQFYLLLPPLLWLVRKVKDHIGLAIITALALQGAVYWLNRLYLYERWPYFASSYFWYISLGFMGLWLGFHYETFAQKLKAHGWRLAALAALFAALHLYQKHLLLHGLFQGKSLLIAGWAVDFSLFTLIWYLFVFCTTLALWAAALKLSELGKAAALGSIGQLSLGIYYIHPGFTFFLSHYCYSTNTAALAVISLLAWAGISALSYIIVDWGRRNPLGAFLLGSYAPRK